MPIFTLQIAGRPVLAFSARNVGNARHYCRDEFLRSELATLRTAEGTPLWNGQAELAFRKATAEEIAAWEADIPRAVRAGETSSLAGARQHSFFVFLVPVVEP